MLGLFKRGWETSYICNTNAKEVSLVWQHQRISSTDAKVRMTNHHTTTHDLSPGVLRPVDPRLLSWPFEPKVQSANLYVCLF